MKTGIIEFFDNYMTIQIVSDNVTPEIENRLYNDGWELSNNGWLENGIYYNIYYKNI